MQEKGVPLPWTLAPGLLTQCRTNGRCLADVWNMCKRFQEKETKWAERKIGCAGEARLNWAARGDSQVTNSFSRRKRQER